MTTLSTPRRLALGTITLAAAGAAIGLLAGPASAHIAVGDGTAPAGGTAVLHFQVPNEESSANTTKVEIAMPTDVVLPFVFPRSSNGWTATVEMRKLDTPIKTEDGDVSEVVSKVTFEGGSIKPGQFDTLDIEVMPLPDTAGATLVFPAIQTYDNGDVVKWIDKVVEGQPEPANPTPILMLTEPTGGHGMTPTTSSGHESHTLGIISLIVAGASLLAAAGALVLSRRRV